MVLRISRSWSAKLPASRNVSVHRSLPVLMNDGSFFLVDCRNCTIFQIFSTASQTPRRVPPFSLCHVQPVRAKAYGHDWSAKQAVNLILKQPTAYGQGMRAREDRKVRKSVPAESEPRGEHAPKEPPTGFDKFEKVI